MPVEDSDIVPTAMNTDDNHSTGCEEAVSGSDDLVRKMTERAREASLSNQIHNTQVIDQRKPWKSRPTHQLSLQKGLDNRCEFSATERKAFWKTRKQSPLRLKFLMRCDTQLCQTG
jgi:hypothetical protein